MMRWKKVLAAWLVTVMAAQLMVFSVSAEEPVTETEPVMELMEEGSEEDAGELIIGDAVELSQENSETPEFEPLASANVYPDLWADGISAASIPKRLRDSSLEFESGNAKEVYRDSRGRLVFVKGVKYSWDHISMNCIVQPEGKTTKKYFSISKKGYIRGKKAINHEYILVNGVRTECAVLDPAISNITDGAIFKVGDKKTIGLSNELSVDLAALGAYVSWQTSNPNVAFVSGNQLVMAGVGKAEIKASISGKTLKKKIEVKSDEKPTRSTVFIGVGQKLPVYIIEETTETDEKGAAVTKTKKKKLTSMEPDRPEIAEVRDGKIIGVAPGHTVIHAPYYKSSTTTDSTDWEIDVFVEGSNFTTDDRLTQIKDKKRSAKYVLQLNTNEQYVLEAPGLSFVNHHFEWKGSRKSWSRVSVNDRNLFRAYIPGKATFKTKYCGRNITVVVIVTDAGAVSTSGNKVVNFRSSYVGNPVSQYGGKNKVQVPTAPMDDTTKSTNGNKRLCFLGWGDKYGNIYETETPNYMDDDRTLYFKNPFTEHTTVHAVWRSYNKDDVYTVKFYIYNSSKKEITARTFFVKKGEKIPAAQLPRIKATMEQGNSSKKVFKGWVTSANADPLDLANVTVDSDLSLRPKFEDM